MSNNLAALATQICDVQLHYSARWHVDYDAPCPSEPLMALVAEQHKQNFDLWHEEDMARAPAVADGVIAQVKRNIDQFNQRRNDMITELDIWLAENLLAPLQDNSLPWNSETIGSVIDRLSISSLKIFHMQEQTERTDASNEHIESCLQKLARLNEQHNDLTTALQQFMNDIVAGRKQNKLYRQFKMYNDPSLNPRIYDKS